MKPAFVFPGQGSQSVGMMKGFDEHPAVRATFGEASSVLGRDLWTLVMQGPQEELDLTVNTPPVMLTAGVAFGAAIDSRAVVSPYALVLAYDIRPVVSAPPGSTVPAKWA